ncbi:hypothetical protein KW786_01865 [Candidatus Parcubacteria bacterium]|nr:hypothetical protein [Candidatus Parcubacteria bacterium]
MNKILGYILLSVGLLLIIVPLVQTVMIFTGNGNPPQIFKVQSEEAQKPASQFDIQGQVQSALEKMLPIAWINYSLNLTNWMVLLFILMFGGGQLANIGIRLIK